jgi:hypothetical protein
VALPAEERDLSDRIHQIATEPTLAGSARRARLQPASE